MMQTLFQRGLSGIALSALIFSGMGSLAVAAVDITAPTISTVSPISATVGVTTNFSIHYTDDLSGIDFCYLTVDGAAESGNMAPYAGNTPTAGTMKYSYAFSSPGLHPMQAVCVDLAGNSAIGPVTTITVASPDTTPPSVGAVAPLSAVAGTPVTLSANYTDAVGVTSCSLVLSTEPASVMTLSGTVSGTASRSVTFGWAGGLTASVRCTDAAGNVGTGPTIAINVTAPSGPDTTPPTIGILNPLTATVGVPLTLSANVSDNVAVTECELESPGLLSMSPMTVASGRATKTVSFIASGSYHFTIYCRDAVGNTAMDGRTVTVSAAPGSDTVAPSVGAVSPLTAFYGTSATFSANYTDAVGVTACWLVINGVNVGTTGQSGAATNGAASRAYTFASVGNYTVRIECTDAAGNRGVGPSTTVVVSDPSSTDTIFPSFIGSLGPMSATVNVPTTYSIGYVDNVGVTLCEMYVDHALAGNASLSGVVSGTASRTHTFTTTGTHLVRFECRDAMGNRSGSVDYQVAVFTAPTDRTPPGIGTVSPLSVTANSDVRFTVPVSDIGSYVSRCELFINSVSYGAMDVSGSMASRNYTFAYPGSYTMYVSCWDAAGNGNSGPVSTIQVNVGTPPRTAAMGGLIKAICPPYYVNSDHPCRAVYYFGRDGRRHAFPHSNVYFTWYNDFSGVVEVSDSFLASVPLGRNVTYRPGIRLVKFTTVPRVFAVGRGSVLHWIASEEVARQLYGYHWNTQVDDIADIFYPNYTFGSDIYSTAQYNPIAEAGLAPNIDANW